MRNYHAENYVALSFLFANTSLTVVALEEDAQLVVRQHSEGGLPRTLSHHKIRCRRDTLGFSVATEHLIGVFLNPAGQPQQQAQPHGFGGFPPSMS